MSPAPTKSVKRGSHIVSWYHRAQLSWVVIALTLLGAETPACAQQDRCYPGLDCPEDLPDRSAGPGQNEPPRAPPPYPQQRNPNPPAPYPEPGETYPQYPTQTQTQQLRLPNFCCTTYGRFGPIPNYGAGPGSYCWVMHPVAGMIYGQACY
jgi:hypothetical protein